MLNDIEQTRGHVAGHENPPVASANAVEQVLEEIEEVLEELVDLEECACKGHKPPKAKRYRIRIDGQK
jgi:hypothetical protein